MMNGKLRLITWASTSIIFLFILLIFSQADKKFVLDAVDFPVLAKAISETGTPFHYRGETDTHSLGLWHPPLYAYSLAAFIKIFGFSENVVHAFGMCCTLLTAFLCLLMHAELFQPEELDRKRFEFIFLTLFLIHPYTIASTTVPDIDTTVLPLTILLFLYGLIRISRAQGLTTIVWSIKSTVVLSAFFAVNLWAKLTTPLALIPITLLIFYVGGWSLRRSAIISVIVAAVGGAIFLLTYWVYCNFLSLPFGFTFKFLAFSFTKNSSSGGGGAALVNGIISHLAYAKQFVNWLGLVFLFSLVMACTSLVFKKNRSDGESVLLIFAGFGLFVSLFYLSLTGAFGGFFKYPYAIFPILVLIVAHFINGHLLFPERNNNLERFRFGDLTCIFDHDIAWGTVSACLGAVILYYQLTVAKDTIISVNRAVDSLSIFILLGAAITVGALVVRKPNGMLTKYGLSMLLVTTVCSQFGISRSQAVAAYPTTYHYGQSGLDETVSYLKAMSAPNEIIWSMKDVGHYFNGRYVENYGFIFMPFPQLTLHLQDMVDNRKIRYFVVTKDIGQDRIDVYPDLRLALDTCCLLDRQFGNFVIYKAR